MARTPESYDEIDEQDCRSLSRVHCMIMTCLLSSLALVPVALGIYEYKNHKASRLMPNQELVVGVYEDAKRSRGYIQKEIDLFLYNNPLEAYYSSGISDSGRLEEAIRNERAQNERERKGLEGELEGVKKDINLLEQREEIIAYYERCKDRNHLFYLAGVILALGGFTWKFGEWYIDRKRRKNLDRLDKLKRGRS